jgi:hypothetical protein
MSDLLPIRAGFNSICILKDNLSEIPENKDV